MEDVVQGGQHGIVDTGEVLVLIGSMLRGIDGAMVDGKIGVEDLGQLMLVLPHVGLAIDNIGNVGKELAEFDEEDKVELIAKVDSAFGEGAYEKVGKELFQAAAHLASAYNAMKAL